MQLKRLTYSMYGAASKLARLTGLAGPLRRYLGPITGRLVFKISTDIDKPALVRGHRMYLASQGNYPPHNMAIDRYEEETTRVFEGLIIPGMAVVDIGAHVGYYTLIAARQVGSDGKVYAFEAAPSNYSLLTRNVELNGYANVQAQRCVVSNNVGPSRLFLTALDSGRHSIYQHGLPENGSVETEATTIDAFLESTGWPRIDLLKIDVEGAELDVLIGMSAFLEKSTQLKIIIELNPVLLQNSGASPSALPQRLTSLGFEVKYIDDAKGPTLLDAEHQASLITDLLKNESSINLLCIKA